MSAIGTTGYTVLNEDAEMYDIIRPAEVCSVETAKSLGLFHRTKYFKGQSQDDVRTFSSSISRDAERPYKLCKEEAAGLWETGESARPLCTLIAPGLLPKKGGTCGRPDGECPPGFTWDARAKTCKKPIQAVKQRREQHCSKQWHDWFTVPNWSFSNGYEMVKGTCYEPCPANTLPIRGTDPVTGESRGTDNIQRCVDKMEYMGGLYGNEPDFCNLAWIKRLSTKMPDIGQEHMSKYPLFAVNGSESLESAAKEGVIDILRETLRSPENLAPHSDVMEGVCARKVDTAERLTDAYAICQNIRRNPVQTESKYIDDMSRTLKLMNNNIKPAELQKDIKNRFKVLKQACHFTFCDDKNSQSQRASLIGKEPICFNAKDIDRADLKERDTLSNELQALPGDYPEQRTEEAPATSDPKVIQRFTKTIANVLLNLVLITCFVMGAWLILSGIFGSIGISGKMFNAAALASSAKMSLATTNNEVLKALAANAKK